MTGVLLWYIARRQRRVVDVPASDKIVMPSKEVRCFLFGTSMIMELARGPVGFGTTHAISLSGA